MRLTFGAVVLITFSIIVSLFLANVAKIISTDAGLFRNNQQLEMSDSELFESSRDHRSGYGKELDDTLGDVMWFLQISDIHISKFKDPTRISDLQDFCTTTIDIIKPKIVLASGDLTDAKSKFVISSSQYEEEWKTYNDVLISTGVLKKVKWIDVRGNHDNFNVPALYSHKDMYMKYSSSKKPRSYLEQIKVGKTTYNFIAVDGCLNPGPKRQFNFVGVLNKNDVDELNSLAIKARHQGGNYTVWFGHFPTSCILTPDESNTRGIRGIIGKHPESLAYLCGHFHTLGEMVPRMYTLHHEGFLELELGDWMRNRLYRVLAIDHGMLSFVDISHKTWPVILITNPKNALFNAPAKEDINLQLHSKFIRMLIFSIAEIVECRVKIDSEDWSDCIKKNDSFFVTKWEPRRYYKGLHDIQVYVADSLGHVRTVSQKFALDGTRMPFDIMARLVLMGDLNTIVKFFFGFGVLICTLPLCIFRFWHILVRRNVVQRPKFVCLESWSKKLWLLATVDRLFFPIISYVIYLTFAPWAYGEVIDGHYGVIFVWGVLVNGTLLPGTLNYIHGFFQLMVCQFPLINLIASNVRRRFYFKQQGDQKNVSLWRKIQRHIAFALIMIVEIAFGSIFFFEYGPIAFLMAPMRTYALILNVFLYIHSMKLPKSCFSSAMEVWPHEVKPQSAQQ